MINDLLVTINEWMTGSMGIALLGCFLWGVVSVVLSPCHMASIPLIVSYVAGQEKRLYTRGAAFYAVAFTTGLFLTIALVGIVCSLLGRMLGDVGSWWTIIVGAVLLWVALDMLGVKACSMPGSLMSRLRVRGMGGAFLLEVAHGVLLIAVFGLGHCIPIAVAGSSAALVRRLLENSRFQRGGLWFRRLAGVAIAGLGVYFIIQPFIGGV
jgi:cytochrome c-type biogenesis protein